jgi:Zn-dependent peptidase ImmA (M78 family)
MHGMSSTAVGNRLESRIFELLQAELSAGRFFVKTECCRIFRRKGYYSKDRGKNIVFDISIEVFLPGCSTYSLLILFECKNYSHSVPVDDAEEFFAKLQQVSGANIKGVIASTNAFQESTLRYSASKGIGLMRYFDATQFKWVLHRSASNERTDSGSVDRFAIYRGLITMSHRSQLFDFYCAHQGAYTNSVRGFFLELATSEIKDAIFFAQIHNKPVAQQQIVDFISQSEIEARTSEILEKIRYAGGAVSLEDICDWQSRDTGLSVRTAIPQSREEIDAGILGRIRFQPLEIMIYAPTERNDGRLNFTLAHELGHHFLGHSKYMVAEYCEANDFELNEASESWLDDMQSMEWQANYFASCLLLPKDSLVADFLSLARTHGLADRGYGILFLDEQPCNKANYYFITSSLMSKYKVSRFALKVRLEELGLLNDGRGKDVFRLRRTIPLKSSSREAARY